MTPAFVGLVRLSGRTIPGSRLHRVEAIDARTALCLKVSGIGARARRGSIVQIVDADVVRDTLGKEPRRCDWCERGALGRRPTTRLGQLQSEFRVGTLPEMHGKRPRTRRCGNCRGEGWIALERNAPPPGTEPLLEVAGARRAPRSKCGRCGGRGLVQAA